VALGACLGDSFEEWTNSVPAPTRNPWSCRAEIFLFDAAAEGWQVFAARIYLYAQEFYFVALRVEDATGIGDECPVQKVPSGLLSGQHRAGHWQGVVRLLPVPSRVLI
jgi:hypothetical protein